MSPAVTLRVAFAHKPTAYARKKRRVIDEAATKVRCVGGQCRQISLQQWLSTGLERGRGRPELWTGTGGGGIEGGRGEGRREGGTQEGCGRE